MAFKKGCVPPEVQQKISESLKGNIPWNKGLHSEFCKSGRHAMTEDNVYVDPTTRSRSCRTCRSERNKAHGHPHRDKEAARKSNLKEFFNMTVEDFEKLWKEQNGCCKICITPLTVGRECHIDHDHACCSTKKCCGKCIRGLLCRGCNHGLGGFKDNPESLKSAMKYLESFVSSYEIQQEIA